MIFAVRVTAGQERIVADMIAERVKKNELGVQAIAFFPGMKGYLFIEADDEITARKAIAGIQHARSVVRGSVSMKELEPLFEQKPMITTIKVGDIVELTSGPFKGERAKVIRVNEEKDEVTVELTEVAIPIPVTVKVDTIRVVRRAEEEEI